MLIDRNIGCSPRRTYEKVINRMLRAWNADGPSSVWFNSARERIGRGKGRGEEGGGNSGRTIEGEERGRRMEKGYFHGGRYYTP